MSRTYTLNAEQAIAGSTSGYQRITDSGAYTGVFTKAKAIKAGTGSEGIEFTFKAESGAEANYLSLYTHNSAGEEIHGYAQLNTLMACIKQREISPQSMQVLEYNHSVGKEEPVQISAYPQLMNVPVGVVLQREEYRKKNGDIGESMNLYAFFDANTQQTGGEVIQQQVATALEGITANLKDKTLAASKQLSNARPESMPATGAEALLAHSSNRQGLNHFDDDNRSRRRS